MILMAIYHFCFDLNNFGVLHENMNNDEFWLNFRAVIMSSFMGLVGVGLYLGNVRYTQMKFWTRLARVGGCAALVTVSTYFLFPNSWTYWGVLHFVVFATLLGPFLVRVPWLCLPAGIALVALPLHYRSLFYYRPYYILTGLSPIKPVTEDFAPIAPWLGVVMIGIFVGYIARRWISWPARIHFPPLTRLGHHSLLFYMVHQAVLFPIAWLISKIY